MNTKQHSTKEQSKPFMTQAKLMRAAGLSAVVAGLSAAVVGMFHPLNITASVTTASWINVHIAAIAMCFFGIFGLAGLYARQAEKAGWIGLAGYILYSLWLGMVMVFSFVEAAILPVLASESPVFVAGFLGMFTGTASQMNLGILPTMWAVSGPIYILGPLLFGIASFRAGILPRWAGALLAVGSLLTFVGAVLPPELEPRIMIPVGLGVAWLGYGLLTEKREKPAESVASKQAVKAEVTKASL